MISPSLLGAMPRPVQTEPTLGLEEVTYGYVPKSMSSIVALAPVGLIGWVARSVRWVFVYGSTGGGSRRATPRRHVRTLDENLAAAVEGVVGVVDGVGDEREEERAHVLVELQLLLHVDLDARVLRLDRLHQRLSSLVWMGRWGCCM